MTTLNDLTAQLDRVEDETKNVTEAMFHVMFLLRYEIGSEGQAALWGKYVTARNRMNAENAKAQAMIEQFQKEQSMRNRLMSLALTLLVAFLLIAAISVHAQDDLATNTPFTVDGTATLVESTAVAPTPEATLVVNPPAPAPEPANVNTLFWIFSAVIFGLLAALVLVLRPLVLQLGSSAPSWAVEAAFSAVKTLLDKGDEYADTTPSPVDNDLVAELRREIESLKAEMDRLRPPTSALPGQTG